MADEPSRQDEGPERPAPGEEKRYGYGGGRWKRWLLIYLIAGAVIYLIVYLAFFSNGYGD